MNIGEKEELPEPDYDEIIEQLSETTERPVVEIKAEIEGLMQKFGYTMGGAIASWKSENKFLIAEERKEVVGRVISIEEPRVATYDGNSQNVGNIHFLITDDMGIPKFAATTAWGDERIEKLYGMFELDKVYKFGARFNDKENLTHIMSADEVDDNMAPKIEEVESIDFAELPSVNRKYEYVRGIIGRVIEPQGVRMGFEVDDMSGANPPFTVWYAGQYSKMTPTEIAEVSALISVGVEIGAYGFISGKNDVSMSATKVYAF
jgi:hypothetical protein